MPVACLVGDNDDNEGYIDYEDDNEGYSDNEDVGDDGGATTACVIPGAVRACGLSCWG